MTILSDVSGASLASAPPIAAAQWVPTCTWMGVCLCIDPVFDCRKETEEAEAQTAPPPVKISPLSCHSLV